MIFLVRFFHVGLLAFWGLSCALAEERVVHVCQWADYFAPQVIQRFQNETGIRVVVDVIDTNEALESKLMASRAGYDLVFPSMTPHFQRQQALGIYMPLELKKLPNFKHLDFKLLKRLAFKEDRIFYGLPYLWGTTGIAYNVKKVKALIPDVPLDSWGLVYDPAIVSQLQSCGVALQDSAVEIFPTLQLYYGWDYTHESPELLRETGEALARVRPFIRKFQGMQSLEDLARGDICVAQVWSSEALRASQWARGLGYDVDVGYILPKEGSIVWADMMAIPKDAPHPEEAYALMNFLLRPDVMAENSLYTQSANPSHTARQFLSQDFLHNPVVYPPEAVMERLHPDVLHSPSYDIQSTRLLTKLIFLKRP